METTFITIHDLTPDARILYSSDSIIDILGYSPEEVVHRSCWDFFHPDELPIARAKHGRGVELDKAAVLSYCRMKGKDGRWLGCEVVFTVVYDVVVGCTSIYRRGLKSQSRAIVAPAVRRLFSTSPRDPRYHMLSHLSSKFSAPSSKLDFHEPRAALFLNRYTRTLTIMYATNGLSDILGISGEALRGKSFYYCIQENCLQDAVRCLENAKANDSIAYLRFWFRNPIQEDGHAGADSRQDTDDEDTYMPDVSSAEEDSGQHLQRDINGYGDSSGNEVRTRSDASVDSQALSSTDSISPIPRNPPIQNQSGLAQLDSGTSSGDSYNSGSHEAIFGEARQQRQSSLSSVSNASSTNGQILYNRQDRSAPVGPIELEAVVSCTSDGLVVCLRRAVHSKSPQTGPLAEEQPATQSYADGLFAVPWATEPMIPSPHQRSQYARHSAFAPSLAPAQEFHQPLTQPLKSSQSDFMNTIRDIAVFAWAIVGINGSLADYGRGEPRGESQPVSGLPIWQPDGHGVTQSTPLTPDFVGSPDGDTSAKPSYAAPRLQQPSFGNGGVTSLRANSTTGIQNAFEETRRTDPAAPSHLVDGVGGKFDDLPKNNSIEGDRAGSGGRSSGFGFGDPGLSANKSYTSKLYSSSRFSNAQSPNGAILDGSSAGSGDSRRLDGS